MFHEYLSIMLLISRTLRQLPVQLAHGNLSVSHTQARLLLKILREESSWNDLKARNRLLARECNDVKGPSITSHLAVAEVDTPTINLVLTLLAVSTVGLGYLVNNEGHPDVVKLFIDDFTRLQKQPQPVARGNRSAASVPGFLFADPFTVRLVQEPQEHIDVFCRAGGILVIVAGRLAIAIAGEGILVMEESTIRSFK